MYHIIMYIEDSKQNNNISTFQGFWDCVIQTLKTTKKRKNYYKTKKPKIIFERILLFSTPGLHMQ